MATCSDLCNQLGKLFVCENPKDSIFWFTTPWVERKFTANDTEQIHQACAYGSTRPKWTKLNANFVEISNVNKTCDGQHKHASWGLQQSGQRKVFATALEVHYPSLLCDAIAENIALALHRMGVVPATTQSVTQSARAFAHYQAGTTKIPTFVPEYKGKLLSLFLQGTRIWPLHLDTTNDLKLLHEVQVGGENMQQLHCKLLEQCKLKNMDVFST